MNSELANSLLNRLEEDKLIQNFISQANARYVLFAVNEPRENFPTFTEDLDERLNQIAIKYISVGCSLAESNQAQASILPLEKGAKLLEQVHRPQDNRSLTSIYYLLMSSLAYYASSQYSKAFILIREVESRSRISTFFSNFIKRNYEQLILDINDILLNPDYNIDSISTESYSSNRENKIYVFLFAKTFASLIEYIFSGDEQWLKRAKAIIDNIIELSKIENDPATWWNGRLFQIIINGFLSNSIWKNLIPTLGDSNIDLTKRYILNLAFKKPAITELFLSQRESLKKVLDSDSKGAVVSLPTGSGKTRIAEIAILDCLLKNHNSKVLYIAPYKSLAFEIEESFSKIFGVLGYISTHLYGGSQFNRLDENLISESSIIIATPEKSKAIIRANPDILDTFQLVVIDEGHLLGANQRYIFSELLIEELRVHLHKNDGKILLLSAVLPNTADIAKWVSQDSEQQVNLDWRPSDQRFGYLEWNGNTVDLRWLGNQESFNRSFIEKVEIKKTRSKKEFPSDKKEAIAATAVKMSTNGIVLIFVAQTRMVNSQASAVMEFLGDTKKENIWDSARDWKLFSMVCEEAYGSNSEIYEFAKYGILCHSSKLPSEVRLCMERLMRFDKPKIIISTSTLGQGVNIGISTLIFGNLYTNYKEPITTRDFWNIAGRAGRAYIDTEGKILFALDKTNFWSYKQDSNLIKKYLDKREIEKTQSGLLLLLTAIKNIAIKSNVDLDLFLQLVSENNIRKLEIKIGSENFNSLQYFFDVIDDSLISISLEYDDLDWIEEHFRTSLAYLQANNESLTQDEVLLILKARNDSINKILKDENEKRNYIKGGISFRASLKLEEILDTVIQEIDFYLESEKELSDLIELLKKIEDHIKILPGFEKNSEIKTEIFDEIRESWLSGRSFYFIFNKNKKESLEICNYYFGFNIPFILNAVSKKIKEDISSEEKAFVIEELSLLCELGLPNMLAAKIYLSGIRSRSASLDLSKKIGEDKLGFSVREITSWLIENRLNLRESINKSTYEWLRLLSEGGYKPKEKIDISYAFKIRQKIKDEMKLNVRSFNNRNFLCSPDYNYSLEVTNPKLKLDEAVNLIDICYKYNETQEVYEVEVRNPNIGLK